MSFDSEINQNKNDEFHLVLNQTALISRGIWAMVKNAKIKQRISLVNYILFKSTIRSRRGRKAT